MFPQNTIWKMDKMTERDVPELVEIFKNEPSIPEGLELKPKQRRHLEAYFESLLDMASDGYLVVLLARKKDDDTLLGGVSFLQYDANGMALWERCFWMRESNRNQGYATAITSAATQWLLHNHIVEHIREMTNPQNQASIRLKRRQGFAFDELKSGGREMLRVDILHPTNFIPQHV